MKRIKGKIWSFSPVRLGGVHRHGGVQHCPFYTRSHAIIRRLRPCKYQQYSNYSTSSTVIPYDPHTIETKWITQWQQEQRKKQSTSENTNSTTKDHFYILSMFPYPSGSLHMGHVRVYSISDTIARYQKMKGRNVLHPMGWDAFGLPAENAAMERGIAPKDWTLRNIEEMKRQLIRLGIVFDWDKEIVTCSPEYYKHTQRTFLQLFKRGLAYQKESEVNWDPVDQTVLANEQVDNLGKSWRSGALVERKKMKQWFFKITDMAEDLLQDLENVNWPQKVKQMQKNWIGKSTGLEFTIHLAPPSNNNSLNLAPIKIFTTRPETILGVSFIAISASHPALNTILPHLAKSNPYVHQHLSDYIEKQSHQLYQSPDKKKQIDGIDTTFFAIHPISCKHIPVFVTSYVEAEYGTGAVMGVPSHDERDKEFMEIMRGQVDIEDILVLDNDKNIMIIGDYAGLSVEKAREKYISDAERNGWGTRQVYYKLKDWLVSRQRYWGSPIPIVHCHSCGVVPVPEDQLPVLLPEDVSITGKGGSPLAGKADWVNTTCPKCSSNTARRETDTMDTFVDSSFYYLRYLDPKNPDRLADSRQVLENMPVDIYIGGIEHAILHLLYARFIHKFLLRELLPGDADAKVMERLKEPFKKLITQGMVQGKTLRSAKTGKYLHNLETDSSAIDKSDAVVTWEKMSKSKHNGVDPVRIIKEYGSDTSRLFILYKAPVEDDLLWEEEQIVGMGRWLNRVWKLVMRRVNHIDGMEVEKIDFEALDAQDRELWYKINETVQSVTDDMEKHRFNTAISHLISLTHDLTNDKPLTSVHAAGLEYLIRMIAPLAPCIAEELWQGWNRGGHASSVFDSSWPKADTYVMEHGKQMQTVAIQVNGKTRGTIQAPISALSDMQLLQELAMRSDVGQKWLNAVEVKKVIVPKGGKIISFVIKSNTQ